MNQHGGYSGVHTKVIDFSVNISPFGSPESVKQGIVESLEEIQKYPSIDGKEYRSLVQKGFNLDKVRLEEIIIGNGAMELIYLFARSLKPKTVLVIQPTFNEYQRAFELAGTKVEHVILEENTNFSISEEKLIKKLESTKPEVLLLCNPNNPTGVRYSLKTMENIAQQMKKWDGVLFVDESFEEFVFEEGKLTDTARYSSLKENLFLLRSLTKFYGIPGLRLGYGIGGKKLIEKLLQNKEPWTINTFAFKALEMIALEKQYPVQLIHRLTEEKTYLEKRFQDLKKLGLKIYPSSTNFYLGKISGISAKVLQRKLLESGIYIRTCEDFLGLDREHFRFAVRTGKDNEKLLQEIGILLTHEWKNSIKVKKTMIK